MKKRPLTHEEILGICLIVGYFLSILTIITVVGFDRAGQYWHAVMEESRHIWDHKPLILFAIATTVFIVLVLLKDRTREHSKGLAARLVFD
ncbi:MAG: hypothetical protein OEY99_05780 [Aigarchaeota archaeon]|nr:hypothetical protein [Aigarchaeota archaeon]